MPKTRLYNQGRIMTFWGPYANEIMGPPQIEPPSNLPMPILNIFYLCYTNMDWGPMIYS